MPSAHDRWSTTREGLTRHGIVPGHILDGKDGAWGARIPDLPGVHGGGATVEEAILDVKSAAREWIAHVASKGKAIPPPRDLTQLSNAGEVAEGEAGFAVILPVKPESGRTVKANVTFDGSRRSTRRPQS